MTGRCAVETWADLGWSAAPTNPSLRSVSGTHVFICSGEDDVYVFNTQDRKLAVVLQFPSPVGDLVESQDQQHLYAACRDGVYHVSLPTLLPRDQSSVGDVSSCPAEVQISCESLAFQEEGVLSVLITDSVLMTLSHKDNSWVLTVYKIAKQSSSFEKLRSLSVPFLSAGRTKENRSLERRPALICVRSGDTPSTSSLSSGFLSDRHLHLEPVLFKLLFGIDAALAKSPVILCGLPDGRLCFLPLHLPGPQLKVLHSLEQPVVFVGASIAVETGSGCALCLVAVGEHGKVLVIKTRKASSEGGSNYTDFTEGCVPGPVAWACVGQQCLYFSTHSDLLELNLSEKSDETGSRGWDKETSSKAAAGLQSPTSLNVCRLVALTGPTHNTTGDVELLGLSVRGQLQRIALPVVKEDSGLSKSTSMQVSHSVGDLVSAIGDVCERASDLKRAIKFKNQLLQHLNQVLNISCLLMGWANSEEKPIRCHAVTSWYRLLRKDSLNLMCVLDNSSPYFLEQGWTLSITVFPLSHSPTPQGERSSTNFLFPIYNLHPGEQLEVSLPLSAADDTLPITVSCALIFSLTSLLGEKEVESLHNRQDTSLTLPLNTLTVDWLHALQVNSPTTHKNSTPQTVLSTTADNIQTFINLHGSRCRKKEEGTQNEKYSASVKVSSDLLKDTLGMKGSNLGPQVPADICVSLVDWLLSEGPGGVRRIHQGDNSVLNAPVIHAQGPSGCPVKVTANEVNLGLEKDSLVIVEVQVESVSLAAVCGLHHAVLRRIQTLVQRAPEKTASAKTVQTSHLRQALHQAERLLQQIQQSRVSGAFSAGLSTGHLTRTLLNVYQELRENPLLIL